MRVLHRQATNKYRSAKQFRNNAKRTKAVNVAPPPQRGGYRL